MMNNAPPGVARSVSAAMLITGVPLPTYSVAQNKIPHRRICNISATSGLILKILEAA